MGSMQSRQDIGELWSQVHGELKLGSSYCMNRQTESQAELFEERPPVEPLVTLKIDFLLSTEMFTDCMTVCQDCNDSCFVSRIKKN